MQIILDDLKGHILSFEQSDPYTIVDVQGLGPADATINTSETPMLDGSKFVNSKVNMRVINLAFAIETDAEENRLYAYKVLRTKEPIRLYYKSDRMDVYVDGWVRTVVPKHFAKKQTVSVSIWCPFPFFMKREQASSEMSNVVKMFHFPFASTADKDIVFGYLDEISNVEITNEGALQTGLIIDIHARGEAESVKIFNYETGEYIGIDFNFMAGDLVTIDTRPGFKTIELFRGGVETNIFNSLMDGSTWLQLAVGGGVFTYEVTGGLRQNLFIDIRHDDLFEGV